MLGNEEFSEMNENGLIQKLDIEEFWNAQG